MNLIVRRKPKPIRYNCLVIDLHLLLWFVSYKLSSHLFIVLIFGGYCSCIFLLYIFFLNAYTNYVSVCGNYEVLEKWVSNLLPKFQSCAKMYRKFCAHFLSKVCFYIATPHQIVRSLRSFVLIYSFRLRFFSIDFISTGNNHRPHTPNHIKKWTKTKHQRNYEQPKRKRVA